MSGIADVARAAGVSKSTASRAISGGGYVSDETKRRVEQAARELGYVASTNAASLVTGRTRALAVIVPRVNRWYFGEMIEGIERELIGSDYDMTLYVAEPDSEDREHMFSHFLARKRFDGLIAVALEPDDEEVERLIAFGKPTLCIGNDLTAIPTLGVDNVAIGRMMTQHLITLGHRRIAYVGRIPDGAPAARDVEQRLAGYEQAMLAAGLSSEVRATGSLLTIPDGYAAAVPLLADPATRPTGIVAVCDEVAIGALIAAQRLGIPVPAALSIIGVDGHDYADMFSLTTVEQRPSDMGSTAVRAVLDQIEERGDDPSRIVAPTRLVVRSSTGPVPVTGSQP